MINKFNETVYIKSHAAKNKNDYVGRTFYGILFILHVSVSDLISSFCYFFLATSSYYISSLNSFFLFFFICRACCFFPCLSFLVILSWRLFCFNSALFLRFLIFVLPFFSFFYSWSPFITFVLKNLYLISPSNDFLHPHL